MAISALGNDVLGDQTRKELDAVGLKYEMPIVPYANRGNCTSGT